MPDTYSHITLVNRLSETSRLEAIPDFPEYAISSILDYFKYCELGSISPDYPYLHIHSGKSKRWANEMHLGKTGEFLRLGAEILRSIEGEPKRKGLAWLLGYLSHLIADTTIHPVVGRLVGPYEEGNQTAHRVCEMNQSAYIYPILNLGEVGLSEHLDSGIRACIDDSGNFDKSIRDMWENMLEKIYSTEFSSNPPNINKWHNSLGFYIDKMAEEGNRLLPFARHVAADCGLTYPSFENIDRRYIENLPTPSGAMGYDQLFEQAMEFTGRIWASYSHDVLGGGGEFLKSLTNWHLDTGEDENGDLVFWS